MNDVGIAAPFRRDAQGKPVVECDDASLYAFGHLMRSTEQLILDLFGRGLLSGTTHTCLGQELCQLSVVRALNDPDDVVLSNHRNHGHFMAYSGEILGLVGEVMGREAGVCGGYGGSQHIAYRHFHSNGVQAGMTGIGVGLALANRRAASRGIVAVMIGDGTLGEGLLYESLNLAGIWGCRMLFVVEHNGIAQTTDSSTTFSGSLESRARGFGLDFWRLDDAAHDFCGRVEQVVDAVRSGHRPGMLVIETCRLGPHSKGDDLRDDAEKARIADRDPLRALGARLPTDVRVTIEQENARYLAAIESAALASPESRFVEIPLHTYVAAEESCAVPAQAASAPNVRTAINRALRDLLDHDPRVSLVGEDLHDPYGGAFKVSAGLSTAHPDRVVSSPISEAGICGTGIGLALHGARPIVEIMFADFITLCMDQIYNHAVKFPGMFAGVTVPLVIRTPAGGRRGYGPTHSQNPENLLVSVPGLTVVFPSHRHNVGQLLVDAVERWPNPTIFLEHKLLYSERQDPGGYAVLPGSSSDPGLALFPILRRGSSDPDLTLLAFGGMLPVVESAASRLEADEELEVETIAPSLLAPLPRESLVAALIERPRILLIEESHHQFGASAEILAALAEAGYRGRVARVGMPPVPIASARSLERQQIPDEEAIIDAALDLL